jgi:hypothetical protein
LVLIYCAAELLRGAASRGAGQQHMGWGSALVVAALVVGGAHSVVAYIHPIGSYDFHDDVVAAAQAADAAHEPYGVITGGMDGGGLSPAQAKRLVGPGNARFAAPYDRLQAKDTFDRPHLSAERLGACYVFPVVKSRKAGIDSVTALSQVCVGPSEATSTISITDR